MLEAGRIDGAGVWTELARVIVPIVLPGVVAAARICLIFTWNEFFSVSPPLLHCDEGPDGADVPRQLPAERRRNTGRSAPR